MFLKTAFSSRAAVAAMLAKGLRDEASYSHFFRAEIKLLVTLLHSETGSDDNPVYRATRRRILYATLNKASFRGHVVHQELSLGHKNARSSWAATSRQSDNPLLIEREVLEGLRAWCFPPMYGGIPYTLPPAFKAELARSKLTYNANDFFEPRAFSKQANAANLTEVVANRIRTACPLFTQHGWVHTAHKGHWVQSSLDHTELAADMTATDGRNRVFVTKLESDTLLSLISDGG